MSLILQEGAKVWRVRVGLSPIPFSPGTLRLLQKKWVQFDGQSLCDHLRSNYRAEEEYIWVSPVYNDA